MIRTTRSRVGFFINKFRKPGFIDYNGGNGGIEVPSSLLNVVLHDGRISKHACRADIVDKNRRSPDVSNSIQTLPWNGRTGMV
jgi:hypothetical protein